MKASAKADEALIELQAQLDKLRTLGFDIRYADLHMMTVQVVPELPDKFGEWCRKNKLLIHEKLAKDCHCRAAAPFLANIPAILSWM